MYQNNKIKFDEIGNGLKMQGLRETDDSEFACFPENLHLEIYNMVIFTALRREIGNFTKIRKFKIPVIKKLYIVVFSVKKLYIVFQCEKAIYSFFLEKTIHSPPVMGGKRKLNQKSTLFYKELCFLHFAARKFRSQRKFVCIQK